MLNQSENQPSLVALVMGVLFLLIGLIFLIGSWGAYFTDSEIQNSGLSAVGQIEKKVFLFDVEGDSDYILKYWFLSKNGTKINTSHHVSESLWNSVSEKQTIEIKYSTVNPKRNFPTGEGVTSLGMSIFTSVFGGLFALFGGALIWGHFRNTSNQTLTHHSSGTR